MTTTTAQRPATARHGLGELVRAQRLYLGLSQRGMAIAMNMDRRSYQRIENGNDPMPTGFLDTAADLMKKFEAEVDEVVAAAENSLATGVAGHHNDGRCEIKVDENNEWERAVVGRAAVESDIVLPVRPAP